METQPLREYERLTTRQREQRIFWVRQELARQRAERAARRRAWLARQVARVAGTPLPWARLAAERSAAQRRQTAAIHRAVTSPLPGAC